MTLDEAIAHAREIAEIQRNNDKLNKTLGKSSPYYKTDCIKCAEEHEQIAEWLEELKSYRVSVFSGDMTQKMLKEQYNKAIEDFVKEFKRKTPVENCLIDEIAEQLKAGIIND